MKLWYEDIRPEIFFAIIASEMVSPVTGDGCPVRAMRILENFFPLVRERVLLKLYEVHPHRGGRL